MVHWWVLVHCGPRAGLFLYVKKNTSVPKAKQLLSKCDSKKKIYNQNLEISMELAPQLIGWT